MTLSLKALVNYRNHHHSRCRADGTLAIAPLTQGRSGIRVQASAEATPFYLLSNRGTCQPQQIWHIGYALAIERDRGIDPYDDHLHAATLQVTLTLTEAVTIVATTADPAGLEIAQARSRRQHRDRQLLLMGQHCWPSQAAAAAGWSPLLLAADQFIVDRPLPDGPGKTVMAGYPWFGDWGRDTLIALPGLAIATGRLESAATLLRTFAHYIDQGMVPNVFPEAGTAPAYNTVDATLWYFEAVRAYYQASQDQALLAEIWPVLQQSIDWYQRGTRYGIHLDSDGLIWAGAPGHQLTWMDAKVGDWVVTPRMGKPIEVNALWYNALLLMAAIADHRDGSGASYRQQAKRTRIGFQRFWSASLGYCQDVLDGPDGPDPSLRPNQIFAVAYPQSVGLRSGAPGPALLSAAQQKAVVDTVARHLLTSHGLRSLAPCDPAHQGHYGGDPVARDGAYHQGTVWGWLIGPFVQAHLTVYGDATAARSCLAPFVDQLNDACLGTLSEIFDGDPPFRPRGAFAQAWTVAEVLRTWQLLANLNPES